MTYTVLTAPDVKPALDRLVELACSDTGQSARVRNFLLAWWNAKDCGGFDIADLFAVDREIAADMATLFAFLGQYPGAIYPDSFNLRDEMAELVAQWRDLDSR